MSNLAITPKNDPRSTDYANHTTTTVAVLQDSLDASEYHQKEIILMPDPATQEKKRRAKAPSSDIETGAPPRKYQKKVRSFDEKCEALVVFKQQHGHINVPSRYAKDSALGQWVRRIRSSQGTKLPPEQKTKLDQLGFDWETGKEKDEKRWNVMLEKLKEYRKIHLDCCVPQGWPEDPQLGEWVSKQRVKEANSKLPLHHKQKLEAIKFQWRQRTNKISDTSTADAKWFIKYQMLVEYREEHGDCLVPLRKDKGPDAVLAEWVQKQRHQYQNGELKERRKKWLDEIGFVYRVDKADLNASRTQKQWDEMFQHLAEFKKENSHVDVKRRYSKWGLGAWVDRQIAASRKGKLDQRRAVRLQDIGITWGKSLDERWEDGFAMLHKYQKKYGHCMAPQRGHRGGKLKKESNRKLSAWVQNQKLRPPPPERKERLDGIGFPWGPWVASHDYYSDEDDNDNDT